MPACFVAACLLGLIVARSGLAFFCIRYRGDGGGVDTTAAARSSGGGDRPGGSKSLSASINSRTTVGH